jgi:hypothetical protein
MELEKGQIEEIKKYAALFYTPKQIAFILGLDYKEFVQVVEEEEHPAHAAFYGGFYLSEMEFRESVVGLAKGGSSPAQAMARDIIEKSNIERERDYQKYGGYSGD